MLNGNVRWMARSSLFFFFKMKDVIFDFETFFSFNEKGEI